MRIALRSARRWPYFHDEQFKVWWTKFPIPSVQASLIILSTVLSAVKESAEKHLNFKRTLTWPHESGYRFVFHDKNDKNREFILTVLVFDVPK